MYADRSPACVSMIGSAVSDPPPSLRVQLRGALQQTRVEIEDVARIRLATRRSPQQQRDLAIRLRVLREVVVDAQRVATAVAEVLADRAGGVRADVQHRRRIRRGCRDDDGVAHRVVLFERPHDLRDRRLLLTDRVVDADHVLAALVDDRVDGDRRLACLTVADDQLALAAADRHHAVDGLEAGLQRLLHRLAIDDARRETLDRQELLRLNRPLAVNRLTERVDDATEHLVADRHRDDASGALDGVAFLDLLEVAEQHGADAVFFEVQRNAEHAVRELEHLAGHRALDAMHARDTITDRDNASDFGDVDLDGKCPIWSRMILEISSALMSISIPVQRRASSRFPILSSCVAMLLSYTTLPTRVTTPPMIDGSTFVVIVTRRPVASARRCSSCAARSATAAPRSSLPRVTTCRYSISRSR